MAVARRGARGRRAWPRLHDPYKPQSPAVPLLSYTTNFSGTENPISESGKWLNGLADGTDWNNVRKTPGLAFAAAIVTTTDDDLACLTTSFHSNQFAQATAFKAGGYSPPDSHEIELLLRFVISAGVARGYEITWGFGGLLQIVRWNGDPGDFVVLDSFGSMGEPVTGDIMRAEVVGNTITVYKNGGVVLDANDNTWTDGQPGMGFFPRTGATLSSLGWSSFTGGEL